MRVMTLEQAADFLRTEMAMDVTRDWVRKQAEPDANGGRKLPVFTLTPGRTATLYTTDEALIAHFRKFADSALERVHGEPGLLAKFLHAENRGQSPTEGKQGVNGRKNYAGRAGWRGPTAS